MPTIDAWTVSKYGGHVIPLLSRIMEAPEGAGHADSVHLLHLAHRKVGILMDKYNIYLCSHGIRVHNIIQVRLIQQNNTHPVGNR